VISSVSVWMVVTMILAVFVARAADSCCNNWSVVDSEWLAAHRAE
jgi:hypothetical protein